MKKLMILLFAFCFTTQGFCFLGFGKSDEEKNKDLLSDVSSRFFGLQKMMEDNDDSTILFKQYIFGYMNDAMLTYISYFETMFDKSARSAELDFAKKVTAQQQEEASINFFISAFSEKIASIKSTVKLITDSMDEYTKKTLEKRYKIKRILQWLTDFQVSEIQYVKLTYENWKKDKKTCFYKHYRSSDKPDDLGKCYVFDYKDHTPSS